MAISRADTHGASAARHELVDLLKRDHERMLRAFREFDHLDSLQACQQVVQRTCAELKVHAAIEEELFYPAVRAGLGEADLVDEAEIEHRSIGTLVEYIELLPPQDLKYKASFRVLGDYVSHHVRDEETEMFPLLVDAEVDWLALADAIAQRRAELCDEFGLVLETAASPAAGAPNEVRPRSASARRRTAEAGASR